MDSILSVKDICCDLNSGGKRVRILHDVSFEVKRGEVFGIVGESGCGKSTLTRVLMRIYPPSKGEAYIEDTLICTADRSADRRIKRRTLTGKMQMIFQDPIASLNPRMTVGEIVAEGLVINGVRDKEYLHDRVAQILSMVGLRKEYMDRYPHEFSGGQRQRIGIARAIIMEPKIIIADEPVSALDVSIQAQVINLLDELRQTMGLTVLFIAHDLSLVKYFSDRLCVMQGGRIVEMGECDSIFQNPKDNYTKSLIKAIPQPYGRGGDL